MYNQQAKQADSILVMLIMLMKSKPILRLGFVQGKPKGFTKY